MVEGWVVSPFIKWGTFDLANNTKMCYTYDELSRVTKRTLVNLSDNTETVEEYTYDAAGNITSSEADIDVTFSYDINNRLASADGIAVTYDLDGNMTFASVDGTSYSGTFDSHNRLVSMRGHTYTYDVQSVRIKDLCDDVETTFVYDTNARLSKLLVKTTDGVTTKYVYGRGLIGEESSNTFKTYHYDYRGSTIAITDSTGAVTDTFAYDTYGKRIARTGSTDTPFQYDGRDGVVTDETGLLYMRARYYCPDLRRFINADVIHGQISDSTSLNRYAYVNGNPVSFVDPFGLERTEVLTSGDAIWLQYADGAKGAGHTSLLIQDSEGVWHLFYWGTEDGFLVYSSSNVDLFDKDKVVQEFVAYDFNQENLINDLNYYFEYVVGNSGFSDDITGAIYFQGDFEKSLEYVEEIEKSLGSNLSQYNLYNYNCMQASADALSVGTFDKYDSMHKLALEYAAMSVVPNLSYLGMENFEETIDKYMQKNWFGKFFTASPFLLFPAY